jgi:hypothetical protein
MFLAFVMGGWVAVMGGWVACIDLSSVVARDEYP